MNQFIRKNLALICAFLLPVILIIIIAVATYLPAALIKTDYNFVYVACVDAQYRAVYGCQNYLKQRYIVTNNHLTINPVDPNQDADNDGVKDINQNYGARIFLHDTKKNESREITFEEAQNLLLNPLLTSPDGVTISSDEDYEPGFLFFSGSSSNGLYLTKGKSKSKLNLIMSDKYYYRDNFQFLGWITNG